MKIAIYEPLPRVAGPVSYVHHLTHGLRQLGHEADIVTFTKSGKHSKTWGEGGQRDHVRWWHSQPDVVARYRDCGDVLDGYDYVILSDARVTMLNKVALDGYGALTTDEHPHRPDYVSVLLKTKTPFAYCLHSNTYPEAEVQHLPDLNEAPNYLGRGLTYSLLEPDLTRSVFAGTTWYDSVLPYRMRSAVGDPPSPGDAVGITGRYVPNKGHQVLGLVGGTERVRANVELHGACSVGAGPSQTFKTYEALVDRLGLKGERFGPEPGTPRGGNILRGFPWEVQRRDGYTVSYKGSYTDAVETCRRLAVHVNLTASVYSDGMDYVVLESIDAGCRQVAVESSWYPEFEGVTLPRIGKLTGEKGLLETAEGGELLDRVGAACQRAVDERNVVEVTDHNREVLRNVFDPRNAAQRAIQMLEGS